MKNYNPKYFLLFTVFLLSLAVPAAAEDIEFVFADPYLTPAPPEIISVTNSSAVPGQPSFKVYAEIEGKIQRRRCCDGSCYSGGGGQEVEWSSCGEITGEPDPLFVPNPTCIPNSVDTSNGINPSVCGGKSGNPMVYYYFGTDPTTGGSVEMTYEADINNFTADIPLGIYPEGVIVTYYIIAVDNRSNVVAQVPDTNTVPCTSISAWYSDYETPSIDNCSYMNSYEECGDFATGTPSCGSSYSLNDPVGDTCDEFGNKDTTPNYMVDIYGISAGVGQGFQDLPGQTVVCSRIRLGANPPDVGSSSGPIDAYTMIIFNPDIVDPNPDDLHMTNAFVITYAPEVSGADPNLVKVLWDGECYTNPNTADILGCKLVVGGPDEDKLKIAADGGILTFVAQNSLPNGKTLVGSSSKQTHIIMATGNIQLDGGTPFWVTDMTSSLNLVHDNQTAQIPGGDGPASPIVPSTAICKWPDGTEFPSGTCGQSAPPSTTNTCKLTIHASPDCGFTGEYKIYHSTVDNPFTATYLDSISSNICSTNYYEHMIDTLDRRTHYYYLSGVSSSGTAETSQYNWAKTQCTVEDGPGPVAVPANFTCATPDGNENKCHCTWTADTFSDPSLMGFYIRRNDKLLNLNPLPAVAGVVEFEYSYTDNSAELVLGTEYTYKVRAFDVGGNESPDAETTCTPEDLVAPGMVNTLGVTLVPYCLTPDVNLYWEASPEPDIAGYNAWYCLNNVPGSTCQQEDDYIKINTSLISGILEETTVGKVTLYSDSEYCFWVQACDNCDFAGTCPSYGGQQPNCSSLNTMKQYRKCLTVLGGCYEPEAPLWPTVLPGETIPLVTTPLPEGGKCELKWGPICEGEMPEGTFEDCEFPTPHELVGYYILKTERQGSGCATTYINPIPTQELPYPTGQLASRMSRTGLNPKYTDENVVNGIEYCYRVYGFDASNNYSRQPPIPVPIGCTPGDTQPPPTPAMNIPISFGLNNCDPSWSTVTDKDTVHYTVHRCSDTPEDCASGDFTTLDWAGDSLGGTSTSTIYSDFSVTTDSAYTYCITASDSVNESDIISDGAANASSESNCGFCTPSDMPQPPSNVYAGAYSIQPNYGVKVWWTDSSDDDGSGMGYNVYLCLTDSCSGEATSCCSAGPLDGSPIDGNYDLTKDEDPYGFRSAGISLNGDYYVGMTYVNENGAESFPAYYDTAITIKSEDPCLGDDPPADCSITINITGSFAKVGIEACTYDPGPPAECLTGAFKKTTTYLSGVIIEVVDATTLAPIAKTWYTDTNGNIPTIVLSTSDITPGSQYKIRARYKTGNYDDIYKNSCSNAATIDSDGYCVVYLTEEVILSEGASINTAAPAEMPNAASGGGGGEIGNPSGNGTVGLEDISLIKAAFGSSRGDTCYRAWADFNMNGQVGIEDISIMKKYFGKLNLDTTAPDFDPTLLQSADPLPLCCATKTCD